MSDRDQDPLKAEAAKREEWRGGATRVGNKDAPGHTLPESESGSAGGADQPSGAVTDTIRPPD